jgi:hypothetical protein
VNFQKTNSAFRIILATVMLLGLGGCASQDIRTPMPDTSGDIAIKTVFLDLGLNRPFGSYDIEGSSIITGKATTVSTGEAAFGAFGAMAAHGRGKEAAKNIVGKYETVLKYDLVSEVDAIVRAEATRWRGRTRLNPESPPAGNMVMRLEPWVYLGASDDGKLGKVGVYLRAFLKNREGSEIWRGGYNYQSSTVRPFEGANGWFANDGRNLKRTIAHGYKTVAQVMMKDSQGKNAGWGNEPVKLRVAIPGGQKPLKVNAVILKRTKRLIIYTPKTGKVAFIYGVNVVPGNEIEILGE